jgi:uncharacterized membrane protein
VQVRVLWMQNNLPGYIALCKYWVSPKFIEMSMKRRQNQGHELKHTYGTDGHIHKAKKMVRQFKLDYV